MMNYAHLAETIIMNNDPNSVSIMTAAITDPQTIEKILYEIPQSDALLFVFTSLLSKSILSGQFCPINQTKSDDNNMKENQNQKVKLYSIIIPRLYQNITSISNDKKQYVIRSCLNAISICLKDLCDNNKNLPVFINILSTILFPSFKVNQYFTSSLNGELVFLEPSSNILMYFMSNQNSLLHYNYSAQILTQLVEYVTMVTVYKSYYEYRRNIYTFRNTYLSSILNVATQYHKILHGQWKKNMANQQLVTTLTVSIALIQKIMTYPFSLTLHEFQSQDEGRDNIVGLGAQIYFPSYYRNILCDTSFLDMIFQFYMFLVKQLSQVKQLNSILLSLIRILGKIICASAYTFNAQEQRKIFRGYCTNLTICLLFNFKFMDSFYIDTLSDIFCKVLSSYTVLDLQQKRQKIYEGFLFFSQTLVNNCQIKLEDGKRNPFNRAFDILANCITQTKDTQYSDLINSKSQDILNSAFMRLYDSNYAQKIMKEFGKNQKNEIQCFEQLFQNIPVVFALNLDKNLQNLKNLQIQKFSQSQQTIWLHLCALLLPSHLASLYQTEIIMKYFRIAKNGNTMACLHYIKVMVNQVLHDMDNGLPTTNLWNFIGQIQKCQFSDFMLYIIKICKRNFQQTQIDIIDYALDVFKSIYMKLRKHSSDSKNLTNKFDPFYQEVKQLISNLSCTIFQNQKFFKRRVQLFTVISTIWINSQNYQYLQQIYNLVSFNIKKQVQTCFQQNTQIKPTSLLKYMHDMRGILQAIQDYQSFKIICELAIDDLSKIFSIVFNTKQNVSMYFSEQTFLKAFCKMVLQFVTDYGRRLTFHIQTQLPFQIYDLFKPYLLEVVNYQYPKCVISIWLRFASLNPLQQMMPLHASFKQKQSKDYSSLIRQYFQNAHRVQLNQLLQLYKYIEDRVEYLCQWWEQIIRRKLKPQVSLAEVVESRIASTKRQKQQLAKLIYYVGCYDPQYWNLQGFNDERQFVKWFLDNYKGFRQ